MAPVDVRIDERSGLLTALVRDGDAVPVALSLALLTGGAETYRPTGGLTYAGTERTELRDLAVARVAREDAGDGVRHVVSARDGDWEVELTYALGERSPRVAVGFAVRRSEGAPAVLLRDAELTFTLALDDPGDWTFNAPGNQCRSDLPVAALADGVRIFSAGDTFGSPGLVALSRRSAPETTVLWPLCRTEIGEIDVDLDADGVRVTLRTGLAARLEPGGAGVRWGDVRLDSVAAAWPGVRDALGDWHRSLGLHAPADAPRWLTHAHVYEAHVGFAVFAGGRRHERYESLADLRADLDRIQGLGFDVLQLMPRHPYPSYNVHDYADVTTSYGDEAELRALVADCHRRGMRVLLDVIMHGVVDRQVVDETLASVRAGPYADRLGDGAIDFLSRSAEDVAWSRHIVEFAPFWRAGAPERHRLPDAHPEWFMRDSGGAIARRYTKAFDVAHPGWQRYFLDACAELVERLGIDGFRVDAPTYNDFATWAPERTQRPSYGPLASLGLLEELRTRLRGVRDDLAVYTEPTGALFRATADATYNYDEHWLVESLLGEPHRHRDRLVRDARELARWLQDRDAALPPGSTVIHHIDSHDSIWWRLPGAQWRAERFGHDAAVALLAVFALAGGGFMTFMGGEDGIEDELRRVHELRRALPDGRGDYAGAVSSSDDVLTVVHGGAVLVCVNLSAAPVRCDVRADALPRGAELRDHWNDEPVAVAADGVLRLSFEPWQPRVLRPTGWSA